MKTPEIRINDNQIPIERELGRGGTKTVYQIAINGLRRALAIPNEADSPEAKKEKWEVALEEPENAEHLQQLGLLVSPILGTEDVEVDGITEKAILYIPWQDLGYEVYDGKWAIHPDEKSPLDNVENVDDLAKALEGITSDIKTLIDGKIGLGSDSINFAFKDGELRLFLSDFGKMSIYKEMSEEGKRGLAEYYVFNSLSKLDNLMQIPQIQSLENKGYDYEGRKMLDKKIIEQVLAQ